MQILRDRHVKTLFFTQVDYVKKVLNKFVMDKSKHVLIPLSAHFRLSELQAPTNDADFEYMKRFPYSSVWGYHS